MGLSVRTNGAYSSAMTPRARSLKAPMTIRSGRWKSSIAAPSLRNSGFDTTSIGTLVRAVTSACIRAAVPTGTVLLLTMTVYRSAASAIWWATFIATRRSALPSSPCGVPTAMNTTSAPRTAPGRSAVKEIRSAAILRPSSSSRPGS